MSVALAAASAACAFAAIAVAAYAGHPAQRTATLIYALFGACSGTACVVVQNVLAGMSSAPPPREREPRPSSVTSAPAAATSSARQLPVRPSAVSAPAADVALTA